MSAVIHTINPTSETAERALGFLHSNALPVTPHTFEVAYAYVSGQDTTLTDVIDTTIQSQGALTRTAVESIHATHFSVSPLSGEAERASARVVTEIGNVVDLISLALTSTKEYGHSLDTISSDLHSSEDNQSRVREIVQSLVISTRAAIAQNHVLEQRLRETSEEISSLHNILDAIRIEAQTDSLTELANRKLFETTLCRAIDHAASGTTFGLLMLDIDHFKSFNDIYGHLTGDQVLKLVAGTIRQQIPDTAMAARFGGEEFAVILPGLDLAGTITIGEAIRRRVESRELVKRSTGEKLGRVTISLGAGAHRTDDNLATIIERVDACLLAAKRLGRNRLLNETEIERGHARLLTA